MSTRTRKTFVPRKRIRHHASTLAVEALERRDLLATFTVTSAGDSSATGNMGELRWAVGQANTTPGPDTIDFAANINAIALTFGQLALTEDVTIDGSTSSAGQVGISAAATSRIFLVDDGSVATVSLASLNALRLTGGNSAGNGGAILSRESLVLATSVVSGNSAASGGAISSVGPGVTVIDRSTLANNFAYANGAGLHAVSNQVVVVSESTTSGNVSGANGGGIFLDNVNFARLATSQIFKNTATTSGGGLYSNMTQLAIDGSEILDNQMYFGVNYGAGVSVLASTVNVQNTLVNGNGNLGVGVSVLRGGGMYIGSGSAVTVYGSEFSENGSGGGGALFSQSFSGTRNTVTLTESALVGNTAQEGGAIASLDSTDVQINRSILQANQATNGGGILSAGGVGIAGNTLQVVDSALDANTASQVGGGIAAMRGTAVAIDSSILSGNTATERGGGVYATEQPAAPTQIGLLSSDVVQNVADSPATPFRSSGGGLWIGGGAGLVMDVTTVDSNFGEYAGGGLTLNAAAVSTITNSTVSRNNTGGVGGGIAVIDSSPMFEQITLSGNNAATRGGGLFTVSQASDNVNLDHSTVSGNAVTSDSGRGGGVYAAYTGPQSSVVILDHTIVSGNLWTAPPVIAFDEVFDGATLTGVATPFVVATFSLLRDNANTFFVPAFPDPAGNIVGSPAAPIDAQLWPLARIKGPTETHSLMTTSPALNSGDPNFVPPPMFDQRLTFNRVVGGRIDMGAVEFELPRVNPDFNLDGSADCIDLTMLEAALGTANPLFDLNFDGIVNLQDHVQFRDDAPIVNNIAIQFYLPGDANLDTFVDGGDFIIWNLFAFTNTFGWCNADFDLNAIVDGVDFLVWNAFAFTAPPPCIVSFATPDFSEPLPEADDDVGGAAVVGLMLRQFANDDTSARSTGPAAEAATESVDADWEALADRVFGGVLERL